MALLLLVATFLSLFASALCLKQTLVIHIDGEEGRDSVDCLNDSSSEKCRSLSFVAESLTVREMVEIVIESGELNLAGPVEFTHFSYLTISGSTSGTHISCCNESGLAFVAVQSLALYSLIIEGCGVERNSSSVDPQTPNETEYLRVAVYVLNCTDMTINRVDVLFSNGTGLSLYNTNGTVVISNCNFANNTLGENSFEPGGGGIRIEFTICTPGIVGNCSGEIYGSNYIIQNCSFLTNTIYAPPHRQQYISPFSSTVTPRLGRGGGLYISIGSNAANNIFSIDGCVFKENVASFGGGGMLAEFINTVQNNIISVNESNFTRNKCSLKVCSGGGLFIEALFYDFSNDGTKLQKNNSFLCTDCKFTGNAANIGGGMSIYATKNTQTPNSVTNISFSNCSWKENKAPMGAAVFISPGVWDYTRNGFVPHPIFTNSTFESNEAAREIHPAKKEAGFKLLSIGYGAVFISEFTVFFKGKTVFRNNTGSAVYLYNSVLAFSEKSSATFENNVGHNGGAIAMFGASMFQIENYSNFSFTNNSAFSKGGAIYVDYKGGVDPVYHNCFISSSDYTRADSTWLSFYGNKANSSGSAIFTTTFQPCLLLCPELDLKCPQMILHCISNFKIGNLTTSDCSLDKGNVPILATLPYNFKLNEKIPVEIIPGAEYQLNLSVSDESGTNLSQVVYEASSGSQEVVINQAFTQVANNTISLLGPTRATAELSLCTADTVVVINVTLADCQPGYGYNWEKRECECRASRYQGLVGCFPVYIRHGYWIGPCSENNRTKLCTSQCPDAFCSYHDISPDSGHHPLKNNASLLDSSLCGPTRMGRMCGRCAPHHSVYFNSFRYTCGEEGMCNIGLILYIIAEILPLTLLFLIILFFNISFTSGNVNCFVLYAQILQTVSFSGNKNIQLPHALEIVQRMVTSIYSPFSLDFFTIEKLSFCLWKGSNFADVMIMKYVTVCIALALVLLTIFLARYGYLRRKLFIKFNASDSVLIHGITAFFVLCYAQSVRVTVHLLNFNCIYTEGFKCEKYAVKRMGYLDYFEGEHVKYAIVAIIVLVFMIAIPPFLLISYPLVFRLLGRCKLSESKLANILWRLMPIQFLDAFQSSFKDKYRLFAGLYFLHRTVILGIHVISQSWLQFYSAAQFQLLIALTVQAIFQPHKEKKHNIIDTLLFANLASINIITFYYYATKDFSDIESSQVVINVLAVVQAVLMLLPLLCIVVHAIKLKWMCKRREDMRDLPSLRSSNEHDSLLKKW